MNLMEQQVQAGLSAREQGQIPVSIGTSLALEGAMGILEDNKNPNPPINNVDVVYINIRTLIRNIVGAVDADTAFNLFPEDIANTLANEIQIIDAAINRFTNGKVEVIPYVCMYESVRRLFPHAMLKTTTTEKQTAAFLREVNTLAEFEEKMGWIMSKKFDIEFDKDERQALILTNYAIDLLQRYKFRSLTLVESHTGATKPPAMWYTKLNNGKELTRIPFDRMTMQLFGDGSNLFSPFPIALRRKVVMIAEKNGWNSMTTKAYILESIKKEHDPVLEGIVLQLYGGTR